MALERFKPKGAMSGCATCSIGKDLGGWALGSGLSSVSSIIAMPSFVA